MEADETRNGHRNRALHPPWAQRGTDLSRMLALSDGIFAFAMTLLVLGLALPVGFAPGNIGNALAHLQGAFLLFALSFFVISFYWIAHGQIFSYIESFDRRLQQLNVLFLLFIVVMPFVTDLLTAASGEFLAVLVYASVQVAAGGLLAALWLYATYHRQHVSPRLPESWVGYVSIRSAMGPIVFLASIPLAYVHPVWGEYSWSSLFVIQATFRYLAPRRGSEADRAA